MIDQQIRCAQVSFKLQQNWDVEDLQCLSSDYTIHCTNNSLHCRVTAITKFSHPKCYKIMKMNSGSQSFTVTKTVYGSLIPSKSLSAFGRSFWELFLYYLIF